MLIPLKDIYVVSHLGTVITFPYCTRTPMIKGRKSTKPNFPIPIANTTKIIGDPFNYAIGAFFVLVNMDPLRT